MLSHACYATVEGILIQIGNKVYNKNRKPLLDPREAFVANNGVRQLVSEFRWKEP
jgi:hypothetical protein